MPNESTANSSQGSETGKTAATARLFWDLEIVLEHTFRKVPAARVLAAHTTRLTLTNPCASKGARDAIANYGAAAGANTAWDRMAALLAGR
jgi:hypothetical protein